MIRLVIAVLLSLLLAGVVGASQDTSPIKKTNLQEFKTHVYPFLQARCVKCHGARRQRAKFALHDIDGEVTNGKDVVRWEKILEMVSLSEMPPAEEPQPSKAKRQQITSWITKELRKIGRGPDENLAMLPGQGNRVDHEALFSGEHKGPAFSKSRVWRMNPYIYKQFVKDMVGTNKILSPLKEVRGGNFKDFAILTADEATIRTMMQNSKLIAQTIVHGRLFKGRNKKKLTRKPSRHRLLAELAKRTDTLTHDQMESAVRYAFQLLLQRQPSSQEVDLYVTRCLKKNIKVGGNDLGVQSLLVVLMMSPEFLFRMEMGLGQQTNDGRRRLSPREMAYAVSFAIYDYPDPILIKAAATGKLSTKEDIAREVRRMLNTRDKKIRRPANRKRYYIWDMGKLGEVGKPKLLRFFREFFGYPKAMDIFKDDTRHGGKFQPKEIIREADLLVLNVLREDKDVFARLLTTEEYFVGYTRTRPVKGQGYAEVYNLENTKWDQHQILPMPQTQRAGILTHPAWLSAFSTNFENDPVRRGKWIRERLLAEIIPEIPIGVQALLPDAPHQTLRERYQVVRREECWRCHKKMNPLGEAFEMYDDFGRYRTEHSIAADKRVFASVFEIQGQNRKNKKKVEVTSTRAVDTTGVLTGTRDPKLDGKVTNAIDLVHRLAKSTRVRQSFMRHVFRFWMGRNETLNDSPTLMAMDEAYLNNGGSFREVLVALLTSDSFLYRK
ncbi:MAG: DUF1588 domain-containing protein [Gemmataceae bacterium]